MVINLKRRRRWRASENGRIWEVGAYRRDWKGSLQYRVFLNGREVTKDTFYVDSRRGIVRRYRVNEAGQKYRVPLLEWRTDDFGGRIWFHGFEAAWEELRGHVKLVRRKAEHADRAA